MSSMTIAIAGATGFVGSAIRQNLKGSHRVIGLTRSLSVLSRPASADGTLWRHCNTHSQRSVTEALEGVDVLIYLIHSMVPTSRLNQASFQDLDLMLADNFARGAKAQGVQRIIYISGLVPKGVELSPHLSSRFEVENALKAPGVPLTTLRCGLIVGPGGSSLRILIHLVRRLPIMLLPKWTRSLTQPIAIEDVLRALDLCLQDAVAARASYDIGAPEVMTYRAMMRATAEAMGKERRFIPMRGIPILLSKRWVSTVGSSSMALVGPLVDSLRHDMVVRDNPLQRALLPEALSFREALARSMTPEGNPIENPRAAIRSNDDRLIRKEKRVRSVQRLPLPSGCDAQWVLDEYLRWLPDFMAPTLKVKQEGREVSFHAVFLPKPLLVLRYDATDQPERKLLSIVGGLLANVSEQPLGRLEFREILGGQHVMAAVHDFKPRLPWYLYNFTQALAHLLVMKAFGRHLERVASSKNRVLETPAHDLTGP